MDPSTQGLCTGKNGSADGGARRAHNMPQGRAVAAPRACGARPPRTSLQSYDVLLKLLVIGDSSTGKTSILTRFSDGEFPTSYISTIGIDFKIRNVDLDGQRAKLQIWDTAGQERFRTITQAYYRGAMGILLVYDVTDRRSFDNLRRDWVQNVNKHTAVKVRKLLVGNKCDLEHKREVSKEEGLALAAELGIGLFETSALRGDHVDDVFMTLARDIRKQQQEDGPEGAPPKTPQPLQVASGSRLRARLGLCC